MNYVWSTLVFGLCVAFARVMFPTHPWSREDSVLHVAAGQIPTIAVCVLIGLFLWWRDHVGSRADRDGRNP